MDDFWFVLYHAYSISNEYDEKALNIFTKDIEFAQKIGIKNLIIEDYFEKFSWGEYSSFWNKKNFTKMIRIAHEYDIKFIPYTNATELSFNSKTYKKYGKNWGAKNRFHKIYSGFNSIYLPQYYSDPKFAFFNKVMCPKSGWQNYLNSQVEFLVENFEIDGIYVDRVDYRVRCFDHDKYEDHFKKELPNLIEKIDKIVKSKSRSNTTIINDSCMLPDEILVKCMTNVDFVLTELLPTDWNPDSIYNRINLEFGNVAWKLRRLLIPLTQTITNKQFYANSMINLPRLSSIITRLKKLKSSEKIILFSHRIDKSGLRAIQKVSNSSGCKICYVVGLNRLTSLKNWY